MCRFRPNSNAAVSECAFDIVGRAVSYEGRPTKILNVKIQDLTPIPNPVRGWVNYFHLHNSTRVFVRQRFFLEQRMRKYLQGRRQVKGFGFRRWPSAKLYKEFGLYAIPQYAPYRRTRMP
jgi:Group II intron, maturase-specific domain